MNASTLASQHGMMPPMLRPRSLAVLAFAALAALLLAAPHVARAAKPKRYYFALIEVRAATGVTIDPATLDAIKVQAQKVLATHPQVVPALTDPPADTAGVPAWRKYLA